MLEVLSVETGGRETLELTRTSISALKGTAYFVRDDRNIVQRMLASYQNQVHDCGETHERSSVDS